MSKIVTNQITPRSGDDVTVDGELKISNGTVVTGVATATTFDGNLTGDVTGDVNAGTVIATTVQADTYVGVPEGTNVLKAMLFS